MDAFARSQRSPDRFRTLSLESLEDRFLLSAPGVTALAASTPVTLGSAPRTAAIGQASPGAVTAPTTASSSRQNDAGSDATVYYATDNRTDSNSVSTTAAPAPSPASGASAAARVNAPKASVATASAAAAGETVAAYRRSAAAREPDGGGERDGGAGDYDKVRDGRYDEDTHTGADSVVRAETSAADDGVEAREEVASGRPARADVAVRALAVPGPVVAAAEQAATPPDAAPAERAIAPGPRSGAEALRSEQPGPVPNTPPDGAHLLAPEATPVADGTIFACLRRVEAPSAGAFGIDLSAIKHGVDAFFARLGELSPEADGKNRAVSVTVWLAGVTAAALEIARVRNKARRSALTPAGPFGTGDGSSREIT